MNLEDVAREAGVSRATVSRVLNNERSVSDKTRTHVLEVVERLNFSPNHAARTLVTQRSDIIGIVIPDYANVFFGDSSYFPMLLQGIVETTNALDYSILLSISKRNENRDHFAQRIIRNRMTDGLVIASIKNDDPLLERLIANTRCFVMVERPLRNSDRFSYVTSDNIQGGYIATQHLIKLGRRRIAHITGHVTIADAQDRLEGYKKALTEANIPFDADLVYEGEFSHHHGYEGAKSLMAHKPDAIFAASDTIALGAIQAIEEADLSVPRDIAIVGFDDLDEASKSKPQLSTIRQLVRQKGAAAANLLIDMIKGDSPEPRQIVLPTELVIRESCGAQSA